MNKTFFSILILCLFFSVSCSQTRSVVDQSEAQTTSLENSLLWKISDKKNENASYLFGTIHMIDAEDYFLPEGTLTAIDQTDKMVFEIDMRDMEDPSKLMGMMSGAFMNDNKTLKDLISEEDYNLVKAHFDKMGIPLMLFERMKPMFLTVFASGDIAPGDMQSGKIKSYEQEFMKIGQESDKSFGGLETIEYQLSVFDSIPYTDQADMLLQTIKNGDSSSSDFKKMVDIYKAQDLNAMQDLMMGDEGVGNYEDVLLVNRNKNWIPIMSQMMQEGPVFFAVGAGHLGGRMGVINLLRAEGYQVEAILK